MVRRPWFLGIPAAGLLAVVWVGGCESSVNRSLAGLRCDTERSCVAGFECLEGVCRVAGTSETRAADGGRGTGTRGIDAGSSPLHSSPPVSSADAGGMPGRDTQLPGATTTDLAPSGVDTRGGDVDVTRGDSDSRAFTSSSTNAIDTHSNSSSYASMEPPPNSESGAATSPGSSAESPDEVTTDTSNPSSTVVGGGTSNGCGGSCDATTECVGSACETACPQGEELCDGKCVDTSADAEHCGRCGQECVPPSNATTQCVASRCEVLCYVGLDYCNDVCINTQTDRSNCGACGIQCNGNRVCVDGECAK